MYKILFADDETVVREGIRDLIDWEQHGFECVGYCENGVEALQVMEKHRPDVLLTDICMPFMDGLELAREVSRSWPQTRTVILTGYDDFDYAQQTVKLKVSDFVLKPITASELRSLLDKIRREMDEEKKQTEDLERLKIQLNESLPLLQERFLERLVSSPVRNGNFRAKLDYFRLSLAGPMYLVFVVDADHFGEIDRYEDEELLRFAVFNIVQEIAQKEQHAAVFRTKDDKIVGILSGPDANLLYEKGQERAEEIRYSVEQYLGFTVSVGIGRPGEGHDSLPSAYRSALSRPGLPVFAGSKPGNPHYGHGGLRFRRAGVFGYMGKATGFRDQDRHESRCGAAH